jgi:hypothetical protein
MKWIYGELRNVNDKPLASYRINPSYIMAVDLNDRKFIIKDFEHPLYYPKEWDDEIYNLVYGRKENDSNRT